MKILHLTTTFSFAGAEQVILDLARGPWSIEVAALKAGDGTFSSRLDSAGVSAHDLNMRSKFDAGVLGRVRDLVHSGGFDIVHTHLVHANAVGRFALRRSRIPVVSTMHIVETRFRPWHDWAERLTAPWARVITGVSPEVCDKLRCLRIDEDKIRLVANGIDVERFHPPRDGQARDIDFLFVGRLDDQKGLDRILPVLADVRRRRPVRVCCVGAGPREGDWKRQAATLGLDIDWVGQVDDTSVWFRRARVALVPSRWEGFGLTAAEALSCGCDLVHSGVDSLTRVAGPHGHILSGDSSHRSALLLEALDGFVENDRRHAWVQDNWSADRMRADYHEVYEAL